MLGSALMLGLGAMLELGLGVVIGASVGPKVVAGVGEALGPLHAARPSDTTAARIRNGFFTDKVLLERVRRRVPGKPAARPPAET